MKFTELIKYTTTAYAEVEGNTIAESSFEASSHTDAAKIFCKHCFQTGAIWGHLVVSSTGRHVGIYQQPLEHKLASKQREMIRADLEVLKDSISSREK